MTGGLLFALVAASPLAEAQPASPAAAEAQTLFQEGLAHLKAGKYAEACPRLAKSQELDPGMGTQYRLAECHEGLGRLATAWELYAVVADAAKKAGRVDREEQARQHLDELRPRLPSLTITIGADLIGMTGLTVTRDGERVAKSDWNQKLPVDPGEHAVVVTAPGKKRWQQTVHAVEKSAVDVTVAALSDEAPARRSTASARGAVAGALTPIANASPRRGGSSLGGQRIAALAAGVAGFAGIGIGVGFGFTALKQWQEAKCLCKDYPYQCGDDGVALHDKANGSALIATAGFAAGGVALAGAAILWILAPKKAPQANVGLLPGAGRDGAGAVVYGKF